MWHTYVLNLKVENELRRFVIIAVMSMNMYLDKRAAIISIITAIIITPDTFDYVFSYIASVFFLNVDYSTNTNTSKNLVHDFGTFSVSFW